MKTLLRRRQLIFIRGKFIAARGVAVNWRSVTKKAKAD